MPELPEVETVRAGLQRWAVGRTIASVEIYHPRAVRRHAAGALDLAARLTGATVDSAQRRGKYLWLPLRRGNHQPGQAPDEALLAHLGMSGQLLIQPQQSPDERHLHVRVRFTDGGPELRFVDQRTFGGLLWDRLVPALPAAAGGQVGTALIDTVPAQIVHIARDPVDPLFDEGDFLARLRRRDSAIKRALLDQSLMSGVGNIYADESLWRARIHGDRSARTLTRPAALALLAHVRAVLGEALAAGGTSFDALYVNVDGQSGYFDRALAVYGRENEACRRCGAAVRRQPFMNRSSYFCPVCQRPPRRTARTPPDKTV